MKREASQSGSSDDGSFRSASPLSTEDMGSFKELKTKAAGRKPRKQGSKVKNNQPVSPHTPRFYPDSALPGSGGSLGPSMLSVLPPPRSLVIRAPPLSLPNGKRKRDGSFGLDDSSPKSSGSSPSANRVAKPSILNRPKSCPNSSNKFDGLDPAAFGGRSPVLGTPGQCEMQSSASHSGNSFKGSITCRSASPNTLHVATALSLLCGLSSGKSPPEKNTHPDGNVPPNSSSIPRAPSSDVIAEPVANEVVATGRAHSESIGDRMDVTSEEDYCEVSPYISTDVSKVSMNINVAPPIYESDNGTEAKVATTPVVNFDRLSAGDEAIKTGASALSGWTSPAVHTDQITSWSMPAVDVPKTPSESRLFGMETRTGTPIETEN